MNKVFAIALAVVMMLGVVLGCVPDESHGEPEQREELCCFGKNKTKRQYAAETNLF